MRIDRRSLMAGLGAAGATWPQESAIAAEPKPWLEYEARLRARILDAGGGAFVPTFEQGLVQQTNRKRRQAMRFPLAEDPELKLAARAHAADMAARNYFGHAAPGAFTSFDRMGLIVRSGLGFFGENLASRRIMNMPLWSAAELIENWSASPIHRSNLLREGFTHAGAGVVQTRGRWYVAVAYAGLSSKLKAPAPLTLDPAAIGPALASAWPPVFGFSVSDPHGELGTRTWSLKPRPPAGLTPGAWRLRPIRSDDVRSSEVLWGPIVVI